jgi:hypothetical protein
MFWHAGCLLNGAPKNAAEVCLLERTLCPAQLGKSRLNNKFLLPCKTVWYNSHNGSVK